MLDNFGKYWYLKLNIPSKLKAKRGKCQFIY